MTDHTTDIMQGTAERPITVETGLALPLALLAEVRHAHNDEGVCLKNWFGPVCDTPKTRAERTSLPEVSDVVLHTVLTELIDRMQRADNTLSSLAATAHTLHSKTRYEAKAEGMRVARAYVEEALREVRNG